MEKVGSFLTTQGKGLFLLLMMLIGVLVPQAHAFTFLIRYLLMVLLFFAFLDIDFEPQSVQRSVFWVLLANVAVAFVGFAVLAPFNITLALAAFITAIAPTAISATVITSFIQRKMEFVVASVVLTNIASALIIPIALPYLLGAEIEVSVWEILQPVMIVMFIPLILTRLARRLPANIQRRIYKGKRFSFPIWLINLLIISANASDYLRNSNTDSMSTLLSIALISLVICVVNFSLGAILGGPSHRQEASQSLGQKNLTFVIWIALTFINPLVALGPMIYIVYHHLYNAWIIYRFEKQRLRV